MWRQIRTLYQLYLWLRHCTLHFPLFSVFRQISIEDLEYLGKLILSTQIGERKKLIRVKSHRKPSNKTMNPLQNLLMKPYRWLDGSFVSSQWPDTGQTGGSGTSRGNDLGARRTGAAAARAVRFCLFRLLQKSYGLTLFVVLLLLLYIPKNKRV